jgi:hypothetical protein
MERNDRVFARYRLCQAIRKPDSGFTETNAHVVFISSESTQRTGDNDSGREPWPVCRALGLQLNTPQEVD